MQKIKQQITQFLQEECGVTTTEYAVMLAVIVVVAMKGIAICGLNMRDIFEAVGSIFADDANTTP